MQYPSSSSSLVFNKIYIVDSVYRSICLFSGQIEHSLDESISYLSGLISHGATGLPVSPYQETILFTAT